MGERSNKRQSLKLRLTKIKQMNPHLNMDLLKFLNGDMESLKFVFNRNMNKY